MAKVQIVEVGRDDEPNEAAINNIKKGLKTLIITDHHKYTPPVAILKTFKYDTDAFIVETTDYYGMLTTSVSEYKLFILVNFELNHFETEFFGQICNKLDKEIICITKSPI